MRSKAEKILGIMLFTLFFAMVISGCKKERKEQTPTPVDYTIVAPSETPTELLDKICEKKEKDFKMTFSDKGYMYIAYGYGRQVTGGYSIVMKELSYLDGTLYFDCELKGPGSNEAVNKLPSYPYIVVKTEDCNANVIFR